MFVQEDRKVMEDMLRGRTGSGEDKIQYAELRLKSISGEYHWFGCHYKAITSDAGTVAKVVGKAGGHFAAEKQGAGASGTGYAGRAYGNLQQGR